MATQDQILKSLSAAIMLKLNGYDPFTEFLEYSQLPTENGAVSFTYEGQIMPCVYGPYGSYLIPGVSVEFGDRVCYDGKASTRIQISLIRLLTETVERQQAHLSSMVGLLHAWIFKRPTIVDMNRLQCPVYQFAENENTITGRIESMLWNWERYGDPEPQQRTNAFSDQGGYIRTDIEFIVHYRSE